MLRRLPFALALAAIALALCCELGARLWSRSLGADAAPAGIALAALAKLDALLALTVALMGAALVLPGRVLGRVQAFVRLIAAVLVLLVALVAVFEALALLTTMVSLLLAAPFGTAAYLAMWGSFDADSVLGALSLSLLLKLVFVIALVIAHQAFLGAKLLLLLTACSLVCNVVATFLLELLPGFLGSIADAALAILFALFALIWALVIALGSIVPALRSLRLERESA